MLRQREAEIHVHTCTGGNCHRNIDKRPEQYGPLHPECFGLKDANQRLAKLTERVRFRV